MRGPPAEVEAGAFSHLSVCVLETAQWHLNQQVEHAERSPSCCFLLIVPGAGAGLHPAITPPRSAWGPGRLPETQVN